MADSASIRFVFKKDMPIFIARFGSLWKIKFRDEIPYAELLFTLMREKGIHIWDGFPCFLTRPTPEADVHTMIEKFEESVNELVEAGFLTSSKTIQPVPAIEPQRGNLVSCDWVGQMPAVLIMNP